MYLPDGTAFAGSSEPLPTNVRPLAVGWLDSSHPYSVGSVDDEFVARLFEACRSHATARTRGWHGCPFCSSPVPTIVTQGDETLAVADAEIRVVAEDGTWLVAPTLVLHYVTAHAYQPPREFIEAVTSGRFAPS